MFPVDYYSKGDRKQEEMKTFCIAFFSDFNHKAARNLCTRQMLLAYFSVRSLRFISLNIPIRKEHPGEGYRRSRGRKGALKSAWLPPGDVLRGRFIYNPLDLSVLICKLGGKTLPGSVMCIKHSGYRNYSKN